MSLESTISAAGYAKVLVRLTPDTALAAADAETAEQDLEKLFILPSRQQADELDALASSVSGHSPARPAAERRVRVYPLLGLATGYVNRDGLVALRERGEIERVVEAQIPSLIRPSRIVPVEAPEEGVALGVAAPSWGVSRLKVDRLWDRGFTGNGVLVGHLDTGIDVRRPELATALHAFAEVDFAGDIVAGAQPHDSGDHGTHTAGTIAGRAGPKGAFGVAPGALLASAMVIEDGKVNDRILAGMQWVIGQGARVLSMSLGLRGFTAAFEEMVAALRRLEVLPVIAVGNEGPQSSRSPGNYPNVVSVGAIDQADAVASFSSSQQFRRSADPLVPDIVAPGVATLSCVPGGYAEMSGTSMATPHIAGLAALLLEARPDATLAQLEAAILQSSSRPGGMHASRANRGVPDGVRALALLQQMP